MIIQSTRIFIGGWFAKAQIELDGAKILRVLPYGTKEAHIDHGDNMVLPGFIDIHTHGAYGYQTDEATPCGLVNWLSLLPTEGVTSFLPTTFTNRDEVTAAALENIATVKARKPAGAEILGAHLEGPFLSKDFRGAQAAEFIKAPSIAAFEKYQKAAGGNIRYVTLAPECDEGYELTRHLSHTGITVSIGHTGASFETAMLAIANGAKSFTHSFNGMKGLHHREPGVVGALMTTNTFAEIIVDGYHVQPSVINTLFKAKNQGNLILVSDSLMAKGLDPGIHRRAGLGLEVEVDENGTAYILGTNTLAGSSLKMNMGIELLVHEAMISIEQAVLAATYHPARALGLEKQKGSILSGADADITVLNDRFEVLQTYCLAKAML